MRGCHCAGCHPQRDEDHQSQVRRRPRVFAFASVPIDMLAIPPPPPPSQSLRQLHRRRGYHRAVRGAQGQRRDLARVRHRPGVFAFVSAPIDTPQHLLPFAHSLAENEIGDEGASALVAILKETQITNLKCAAAPKVFAFVSAPADTHSMLPLLAVSTATRFRSTSSKERSRPSGSTSRARGSGSPPPSSSRAASRRTACSRS